MFEVIYNSLCTIIVSLLMIWVSKGSSNDKNILNDEKFSTITLTKMLGIALVLSLLVVVAFVITFVVYIIVLVV